MGAGFAGLTLANALQQHQQEQREQQEQQEQNEDDRSKYQRKKISFELFEAKDEPIPIVGQIRLPHGQRILEQLNLPTPPTPSSFLPIRHKSTSNNNKDKNNTLIVQQQVFLKILRQRLVNKIHYGCRITDIVRRIQPSSSSSTSSCCCLFYLKTTTNNSGGQQQGQEFGPFDTLVVADGLFGSITQQFISSRTLYSNNNDLDKIRTAIIGDARWQYEVGFWDFGQRRRKRGGDIAMVDAMELAALLCRKDEDKNDKNDMMQTMDHITTTTTTVTKNKITTSCCSSCGCTDWDKFQPQLLSRSWNLIVTILLVLVMLVMGGVVCC